MGRKKGYKSKSSQKSEAKKEAQAWALIKQQAARAKATEACKQELAIKAISPNPFVEDTLKRKAQDLIDSGQISAPVDSAAGPSMTPKTGPPTASKAPKPGSSTSTQTDPSADAAAQWLTKALDEPGPGVPEIDKDIDELLNMPSKCDVSRSCMNAKVEKKPWTPRNLKSIKTEDNYKWWNPDELADKAEQLQMLASLEKTYLEFRSASRDHNHHNGSTVRNSPKDAYGIDPRNPLFLRGQTEFEMTMSRLHRARQSRAVIPSRWAKKEIQKENPQDCTRMCKCNYYRGLGRAKPGHGKLYDKRPFHNPPDPLMDIYIKDLYWDESTRPKVLQQVEFALTPSNPTTVKENGCCNCCGLPTTDEALESSEDWKEADKFYFSLAVIAGKKTPRCKARSCKTCEETEDLEDSIPSEDVGPSEAGNPSEDGIPSEDGNPSEDSGLSEDANTAFIEDSSPSEGGNPSEVDSLSQNGSPSEDGNLTEPYAKGSMDAKISEYGNYLDKINPMAEVILRMVNLHQIMTAFDHNRFAPAKNQRPYRKIVDPPPEVLKQIRKSEPSALELEYREKMQQKFSDPHLYSNPKDKAYDLRVKRGFKRLLRDLWRETVFELVEKVADYWLELIDELQLKNDEYANLNTYYDDPDRPIPSLDKKLVDAASLAQELWQKLETDAAFRSEALEGGSEWLTLTIMRTMMDMNRDLTYFRMTQFLNSVQSVNDKRKIEKEAKEAAEKKVQKARKTIRADVERDARATNPNTKQHHFRLSSKLRQEEFAVAKEAFTLELAEARKAIAHLETAEMAAEYDEIETKMTKLSSEISNELRKVSMRRSIL